MISQTIHFVSCPHVSTYDRQPARHHDMFISSRQKTFKVKDSSFVLSLEWRYCYGVAAKILTIRVPNIRAKSIARDANKTAIYLFSCIQVRTIEYLFTLTSVVCHLSCINWLYWNIISIQRWSNMMVRRRRYQFHRKLNHNWIWPLPKSNYSICKNSKKTMQIISSFIIWRAQLEYISLTPCELIVVALALRAIVAIQILLNNPWRLSSLLVKRWCTSLISGSEMVW